MGSADYSALLIDVMELTENQTIPQRFKQLLLLTELKFKSMRLAEQETLVDLDIVGGEAEVPEDFLEVRDFHNPAGRSMRLITPQVYNAHFRHSGGIADYYTRIGNKFSFLPAQDFTAKLLYYAKVPPLTPENPVNWLLAKDPDIYLYGVSETVATTIDKNLEKAQLWGAIRQAITQRMKIEDERSRWGNAQAVVGGLTP